jgi:hypothetical protein
MNHIRVQSIIDRYPEAEQIFSMYELDLSESVSKMTIEEVADVFGLDLEDIVMDLEELMQDSKQADWLTNGGEEWTDGGEEWTDGFTEEQTGSTSASKSLEKENAMDTEETYDENDF